MQNEMIEGFRLAPQQRHLCLLQQGGDYDPNYRTQCTVEIGGPLNPETLRAAIEQLIDRYELFRTTFHQLPGLTTPVQLINEPYCPSFDEHNLSGLDSKEQQARIDTFLHEAENRPFDMQDGPLLHLSLVTLSPSKHLLHISLPSLCADVPTMVNLVREISGSYATLMGVGDEAYPQGVHATEPMQYADLAEWLNELFEAEDAESGIAYWREQMADFLKGGDKAPPLRLPFENQPTDLAKFAPQRVITTIEKKLVLTIETFVEKNETSAPAFLLACWQILLWRLTEQSDFVIGYGYNGRTYEELEDALGLFAKYLPLRCHLEEDFQFHDVLRQVGESIGTALDWGEYFSWEQIVESSGSGENHFFPLSFDYDESLRSESPQIALDADSIGSGFATYSAGDVSFSIREPYACVDRFKVRLSCIEADGRVITAFHYDSNVLRQADIQRLAGQFHALLESAANNPQAPIGELNILSKAERQQLLVEFNQTATNFPKDRCIHHLIEAQVEQRPEDIAVMFEEQELDSTVPAQSSQLTYAQLNAHANQLAHYLRKRGVGPEVLVGLCVERSLEMMIGLLGILKAGGAYVPMDVAYPQERLAFMLADTQAPVLLTQQRLLDRLPEHGAQVVCLDTDWHEISEESASNPISNVKPENLAYIIYTSGSTGLPKGVQISHRNLVHSTHARPVYYREPVARFLLLSSFAFDSSVAGLFWTLCDGGTLILPQEETERNPSQVKALITRTQSSHMLSLPSLYALLLAEAKPEDLVSLRAVIVAGEVCPKDLIDRHHQMLTQTELFNEYGITEVSVWSTVHNCQPQQAGAQAPIGRPIANTQLYLLDASLNPIAIGIPGELYIGGAGLARGYLNRPDLTAERFIPNPFSDEPGSRLYKTGDLACYQPNGVIEFLGRIDQQVKIRGYRIELEEIEAILAQYPDVKEVVVVAREESEITTQSIEQVEHSGGFELAPDDTEALVTRLLSLGEENSGGLLAELENLSEAEAEAILAHEVPEGIERLQKFQKIVPDFDVTIQLKNDKFIAPPRAFQRNGLINQVVNEVADELVHLDETAKRFVPGREFRFEEHTADISQAELSDQELMEDWQHPIMKAMAKVVTETHGNILELGFGKGVSANFIQECGVKSHTIVESNDSVVKNFYEPWRRGYPDRDIRLIHRRWQDAVDQFDVYDGIFFHTFPVNEDEFMKYVVNSVTFAEHFFPTAASLLREGGIFTYLTHEIDSLSRRHQRLIFKYFSTFALHVEPLSVREDTKDLWWADSMVIVKAVK